jgi:hypothetical protein
MSVTHEMDPGCSVLGHLFRTEGDERVCITCGCRESGSEEPAGD